MLNILYIEDDLTSQKIIKHKLKQFNIGCDVASNEEEGVMLFKNNSYDVIILDYHLQNTTGDKILENLNNTYLDLNIYSILITGDSRVENKLKDKFDKIFIKPIFGSNFFNFIKELKTIIKNKSI